MIEKDKIILCKSYVFYENKNLYLLKKRQFIVNALFINDFILAWNKVMNADRFDLEK